MYTISELAKQIKRMGIGCGDVLLVRASVSAIGVLETDRTGIIEALLNVLGESGTLVSLAYTTSQRRFFSKPCVDACFTKDKKSYAGALPNMMLENRGSRRSLHPTHSVVAIGRRAEELCSDHGPHGNAFDPIQKLLDWDAKMLLVGCVSSSPGFTTAHLAEHNLGLGVRYIAPWANQVFYIDSSGERQLFRHHDSGFCSDSYNKFYSHYLEKGILNVGRIGDAYSISARCKDTYNIEKSILKNNPRFNVCDNNYCPQCNLRRWDRVHMIGLYWLRRVARFILNRTRNIF